MTMDLDELASGPCGQLASVLAARGQNVSVTNWPEPGIFLRPEAAAVLLPRTWLYGLTADEWFHLASEGQDSEVAPCCGSIGDLREYLSALASCQGEGESGLMVTAVLAAYEAAADGHDAITNATAFPLLHRVLAGIRAERAAQEESARAYQAAVSAHPTAPSPEDQS